MLTEPGYAGARTDPAALTNDDLSGEDAREVELVIAPLEQDSAALRSVDIGPQPCPRAFRDRAPAAAAAVRGNGREGSRSHK
jgi:hypothetical protein